MLQLNWLPKPKLNDDDQQIVDFITNLLQTKEVDARMTSSGTFYIEHRSLHYYVVITEQSLRITNSKGHINKKMYSRWYSRLIEPIKAWISLHEKEFEDQMFNNERSMVADWLSTVNHQLTYE